MKKLNKIIALALTASLLSPTMGYMAEENTEETTETAVSVTAEAPAEEAVEEPVLEETAEEVTVEEVSKDAAPVLPEAEVIDEPVLYSEESMYPYTEQPVPEGEYIPNTYGYPIQGDPYNTKKVKQGIEYSASKKTLNASFWLRDSDFFGVWDEENQKWTTVSKLNYEEFPELEKVESAAKKGEYEQAKLAYYNYYVEKEKTMNRTQVTSDAVADRITADLLCKNFMYNAQSGFKAVALMNVGNTKEYRGVDVASTVTSYLGTREYLVFYMIATDKNGDWAEFDSKEGENRPYLKVRVDGAEKIIYPEDDTNIKAGSNKSKAYGTETMLTAREDEFDTTTYSHSANSNDTTHIFVNENTSRIYLKFNVSQLKAGDTIQSATLNLYGSNMIEGQEKEVAVFYSDDSSWEEESLTYSNATAQVMYSYDQAKSWYWNQPISAGSRYQEELLRFNTWFDKLVKLYHYTGDEKYAYTAIRQFMDYINVRGDDPCWLKSLDVAVRTQCMPGLWLQLMDSQYMSPEVFTAFMKWCYVQGTCSKYFTRTGNWGTSESLGLYVLSINFPEFTDATAWLERVRVRYESLSNDLVRSDYVCTELSLGYTDYTLETLLSAKTSADDLGIDWRDWSPYSQQTLDNIEHLGLYMYWSSLPGVSDNQVGDGYSHRGNFKTRITTIADMFDNEQLKYAATGGDEGKMPDFTSKLFPEGRRVIMRTNWSEDKAMYLYTDVDGGYGNHAHPDDNNIIVEAHGQYLLVDPLYGTYSASASKTWLTSSIAHNTVVVNGGNQSTGSGVRGSFPRWETNNTYDFVKAVSKAEPDASAHNRSTFFYRDRFFIVNDYLVPKNAASSNKYVQAWHYLPEAGITIDDETKTTKTNFLGANIQVVPIGADEFTGARIVDGLYSEGQGSIIDAKYTEYEKNGTGDMIFNTLLLPEETGEDYEVSTGYLEIDGISKTDASAMDIYITSKLTGKMNRYVYYLRHNDAKSGMVKVDDFTTDASMLFVEMDSKGNIEYVAMQDATTLDYGTKSIYTSDNAIEEIGIKFNGNYAFVDSSVITDSKLTLNNLKIAQSGNVTTVKVNGEESDANVVDGYIYFGTIPTPNPSAEPAATPKPTKKPTVHAGGSGGGGGGGGSIAPVVTPSPQTTPSPTENPSADGMNTSLKSEIESHWAGEETQALYDKGIVKGQTETSFGLEKPITRAEFVTLLMRALEIAPIDYQGAFADVRADDWYAQYIEAAYQAGIFNGTGENAEPNNNITREQMAKMLAFVIEAAEGENIAFADENDISDWAKDSVDKVVKATLMKGRENNLFDPKAYTKRCEAFAVIYRLINK